MPITRHFLGWDVPPLGRAVDWLIARHATPHEFNLSGMLLVVPARRAGRRLLELLATASAGRVLSPPRIITPSALPEHLYVGPVPEPDVGVDFEDESEPSAGNDILDGTPVVKPTAVASPLAALLARVHALRGAPADELTPIIPSPPEPADFSSWLALASDLARLDDDLAAHALIVRDVPRTLEAAGRPLDDKQASRWNSLAVLQHRFERTLETSGLFSLNAARRRALSLNACRCDQQIVLVASSDLSPLQHAMLRGALAAGAAVTALVHAPESEAGAFDDLGGLVVDDWAARNVELGTTPLLVVDRPRDQAMQVVRSLGEVTQGSPALSPDDVTVGLGDETIAPLIERALGLAGTTARHAAGKQVARSRPVKLLEAWAAFVSSRRLRDLASLVRHPDAEAFLDDEHRKTAAAEGTPHWPSLLDRFISEHLQGSTAPDFVRSHQTPGLRFASTALLDLAQEKSTSPQPLAKWAPAIAGAMTRLYEAAPLSTTDPAMSELVRALRAIGAALRQLAALPDACRFAPRVTLKETVALVVSQLTMALPPVTLGPAVELLGWLELSLDDAPVLFVTGLNEGQIPQSVTADPFLPDSTRSGLGMLDNRRRYARDLLALTSILRSNRNTTLIAGRRSADGDPAAPSRLLLACPTPTLIKRLTDFYSPEHESSAALTPLIGGAPAARSQFVIPLPIAPHEAITKLNVTAFADYIRCPYRFYLKHVRKLQGLDDQAVELGSQAYGTLVHKVLQSFAASGLAASEKPDDITGFFIDRLDEETRTTFGARLQPAVSLQLEQLRFRLELLAHWQAQQAREGWRIVGEMTEKELTDTLDLGEGLFGFSIEGRIDRIDFNEASNTYRVIDYKTSDKKSPDSPEKKHRGKVNGELRWLDLQLPLYHKLVSAKVAGGAQIELAYVNLPTKAGMDPYSPAEWTPPELESAFGAAAEVARGVRDGRFWPPNEPPIFEDEYSSICLDASPGRAGVIRAQHALLPRKEAKR